MLNKLTFIVCCSALLMQACHLFSEAPTGNPGGNPGGRATLRWQTNYEEAVKQSKESSKPLVLLFTGSDWCSWCTKLEEEALNTPDFASIAGSKFTFVKLDFPLYSSQDPQIKAQNKQLQQKFDVRSYPSVIIYDAKNNQTIGTTGYRPGGGKQYAEYLLKLLNDYSAYKQKLSALDKGNFSGSDLKQLYDQAIKLDMDNDATKIVNVGIKSDKSLFFMTKRYEQYAAENQIHTPEAIALRKQLLAADPNNEKQIPYQIAMIEFETYSEEMDNSGTPEVAISPLNEYIEKFGNKDKENSWRLQMIISQVYLDNNQMPSSLKHAQFAYEAAPFTAQPEIARAIQNIRRQITPGIITKLN